MNDKHPEMGRPPQYGEAMKETSVRLRIDQIEWLNSEAIRRGVSRNDIVRELVDERMNHDGK